jgi:hypothetical protein
MVLRLPHVLPCFAIHPEDALHLGGAQGLFTMPPNCGMTDASATGFHAVLNEWPKARVARLRRSPPPHPPAGVSGSRDELNCWGVALLLKRLPNCRTRSRARVPQGAPKKRGKAGEDTGKPDPQVPTTPEEKSNVLLTKVLVDVACLGDPAVALRGRIPHKAGGGSNIEGGDTHNGFWDLGVWSHKGYSQS